MEVFTTTKTPESSYTDEQLDALMHMERHWKESLPSYSIKDMVEMFPEGRHAAKRYLRGQIKLVKQKISDLDDQRTWWHENHINKANHKDQPFLIEWLNKRMEEFTKEYEKEIQRLAHQLNMLDRNEDISTVGVYAVSETQIDRAKQTPISSILKVNRAKKTHCVWHEDKNPSMHVYGDRRVWCFACGRGGDAIDLYMLKNGCDFKEAVRRLAV